MGLLKTAGAAVLYLWQLPQNLIGLLLLLWFGKRAKVAAYRGRTFYVAERMHGGISLGKYILLSPKKAESERTFRHEYGHSRQSLYLGPLYLLVIGIPSIFHASIHRTGDYYHFYTERWADRLGGITQEIQAK